MTSRLPVSEGAMTALRQFAVNLGFHANIVQSRADDDMESASDQLQLSAEDIARGYEELSALLDRLEVIDPNLVAAKVMETHRAYVRSHEHRSFWAEAIAQKAELVAYVCGQTEEETP